MYLSHVVINLSGSQCARDIGEDRVLSVSALRELGHDVQDCVPAGHSLCPLHSVSFNTLPVSTHTTRTWLLQCDRVMPAGAITWGCASSCGPVGAASASLGACDTLFLGPPSSVSGPERVDDPRPTGHVRGGLGNRVRHSPPKGK